MIKKTVFQIVKSHVSKKIIRVSRVEKKNIEVDFEITKNLMAAMD